MDDPAQRQVLQDSTGPLGGRVIWRLRTRLREVFRDGPHWSSVVDAANTGRAVPAAANLNRRRLRALLEAFIFRGNPRMTAAAADKKKLPLHWKMGIGFAIGLVLGLIVHALGGSVDGLQAGAKWVMDYITTPASGPVPQPDLHADRAADLLGADHGRVGDGRHPRPWPHRLEDPGYTVLLSGIAVGIGLVLVNLLKPGAGVDPQVAAMMLSENAERSKEIVAGIHGTPKGMDMLLSIVPSNVLQAASDNGAILSLMFFALMFGIGMVLTDNEKDAPLRRAIEGVFEISMTLINLVIRLAPYAVACFMFNLAALFGFELIIRLGAYVGVVAAGPAHDRDLRHRRVAVRPLAAVVLPRYPGSDGDGVLHRLQQRHPADRAARGRPDGPARVALRADVGATANQNGTALFEGVTVIFLAQFFGVDLSIGQQIMVMAVCILGGIGTAGVPSGSLVAMICAMVGVNPLGIGLILGVNHF